MPDLAVTHACILSLALLTPFTLSPSVDVFLCFSYDSNGVDGSVRVTASKGREGHPDEKFFFCTSWDDLNVAFQCFKHSTCCLCSVFSHIANFQPKFYVGSTSSFVLDREHSRYRKFLQVQQNKFVLAEVALRFWCRYDNFWMWSDLTSLSTPRNPTFGLWNKPYNSTVATSIEYSVHLSVFQLSKRTHPSYKVLELTSIWNLLVVAQTTMEVNPYASSTSSSQSNIWSSSSTLGNHSRPG